MLTTLVMAAAIAAPSTVAPVNFVHGYKQDDKLTYEMKFAADEMDMEASMTFVLTVGATKGGNTNISLEVIESDMGGFGMMEETEPVELVLDKNGVPLMEGADEGDMMIIVSLMTTYLPNKRLEEGGTFEFKRGNDEFQWTSKGKFSGMEKVDSASYAVLESDATVVPTDDDEATVKVKTYYNPSNKRVERTSALIDTPDGVFNVSLKLKK